MKNPLRYLIVLIVFFAAWRIGWNTSPEHERLITDLINHAGRNQYPIIGITENHKFWGDLLMMYTIDHDPVGISMGGVNDGSWIWDDDGTIYIGVRWGSFNYHETMLRQPDRGRRIFNSPQYFDFVGGSDLKIKSGGRWGATHDYGDSVIFADSLTLDMFESAFESEAPWSGSTYTPDLDWEHAISPDRSHLVSICDLPVRTGRGGSWISGGAVDGRFWIYSVESRMWHILGDYNNEYYFHPVLGPGGTILAFDKQENVASPASRTGTTRAYSLIYIDTVTGDTLHMEPDGKFPQIGNNWAACLIEKPGKTVIKLLNLNDKWQELEIEVGSDQPFLMYEPPEQGLAAMYENYDWNE